MATNIGPRIGIDGEDEYRKSITKLIQQGKTLDAQMRAVGDSFADEAEAQEAAAEKAELLQKRIEAQRKQVELLADMVAKSTQATAADSSQTLKWEEALANATAQLHKLEDSAQQSGEAVEDLGQEMDSAGGSSLKLGDLIKANLTSDVILGGLKKLAELMVDAGKKMVELEREAAAYADEMLTLSTTSGLSTQTLQEFSYMAELTDTSVSTIVGSLSKLTKQMSAAKGGSDTAKKAFADLGVAVTDSDGRLRDNEAVFYELLDALGKVPNETERDALAMTIFGKSAQDLNSLIAVGSDGIAAFAREAKAMGYVLDDEALAALGAADDGFQRMNLAVEAAKNRLGLAFAPVVTEVSDRVMAFAATVDWELWSARIGDAVEKILRLIDWLVENGDKVESTMAGIRKWEGVVSSVALSSVPGVDAVRAGWNALTDTVGWSADTISGFQSGVGEGFEALTSSAPAWGQDLIDLYTGGILSKAQRIFNAARYIASGIAAYLHFSVPEKGPLSDLDQSPKDMVEMYAKGLDANAWRLDDAAAALAGDLSAELTMPTLPAAGRGGPYYYGGFVINIYGAEGQDEEALADAVMDRIQGAIDDKEAVFA